MFWFQQGKALPKWTQRDLLVKGCSGVRKGDACLWLCCWRTAWAWKVPVLFYIPIREMALMKNLSWSSNVLYCKICTDMWNYVGFFKEFRIVPTCWLAPFGRLFLHSHWNSGQHSQLTHKVLLRFLHARTKQQSLNTAQLSSGLCYSTCGMTKQARHCRNTGNYGQHQGSVPTRQWWMLALISTRVAKRLLESLLFCHWMLQIHEPFYPYLPLADSPTRFLGGAIPAASVSETPDEFVAAVQTEPKSSSAVALFCSREM